MPVPRAALAALATLAAAPAAAVDPFEIQVYEADVNDPGQASLEVHLNFAARGTRAPAYPGQVPPYHVGRLTLEPALGVTDWLEVGAYVQLMQAPGGDARFGGWKARTKLVVPESRGWPVFVGLNVELGRAPRHVDEDRWGNELRPFVGVRSGRWLVSVNPIFGWALTGPDRLRPDLEPCGKVTFDTRRGFAVGAEYYASLGFADDLAPLADQEHLLFAVVDLVPRPSAPGAGGSPWELNVGLGVALTDAPGPHVLAKAIVGRAF